MRRRSWRCNCGHEPRRRRCKAKLCGGAALINSVPWLSALWLVPLTGAVLVIVVPPQWRQLAKWLGLAVAVAVLALAIVITVGFHTGGAPYQFIESQINLLCLLHEVKTGVMSTSCKLMEAQRIRRGEPEDFIAREMQKLRAREERDLTGDLKERVSTVEGQWTEALGSEIQGLRERVKEHLVVQGGWDDIEQLE